MSRLVPNMLGMGSPTWCTRSMGSRLVPNMLGMGSPTWCTRSMGSRLVWCPICWVWGLLPGVRGVWGVGWSGAQYDGYGVSYLVYEEYGE